MAPRKKPKSDDDEDWSPEKAKRPAKKKALVPAPTLPPVANPPPPLAPGLAPPAAIFLHAAQPPAAAAPAHVVAPALAPVFPLPLPPAPLLAPPVPTLAVPTLPADVPHAASPLGLGAAPDGRRRRASVTRSMRRGALDAAQKDALREQDTAARRRSRDQLDDEERDGIREQNAAAMRRSRDQLPPEQRAANTAADTAARQQARDQLPPEQRAANTAANTAAMQQARDQLPPEQRAANTAANTLAQRRRRYGCERNTFRNSDQVVTAADVQPHALGLRGSVCTSCGSIMWAQEQTSSQGPAGSFSMCCSKGKDQGCPVVLPSSFTDGPRARAQDYQDSMATVRKIGKTDLFITATCNPKWKEVQDELRPGMTAAERGDLMARVFKLKLEALLRDITVNHVFGKVKGHVHVIEFQKRGLPHAHILVWLHDDDKLRGPDDYDQLICAELPHPQLEPELFDIVTTCSMHGPCGLDDPNCPCMVDGVCSKHYPKDWSEQTVDSPSGYPVYRRRDDGRTFTKRVRDGGGEYRDVALDNRSVVPYNKALTLKYDCHINVEYCASIRAVKYLHKYLYKGPDRALVELAADAAPQRHDEIKEYLDARYLSASEAYWRTFDFRMHGNEPTVTRLAVHLPGDESVRFTGDGTIEQVLQAGPPVTTLTAWFAINADPVLGPEARRVLYMDFPEAYTYDDKLRKWKRRQRMPAHPVVGRMYFVHPRQGEQYYLRVLLCHVAGAVSYEDLRTVPGHAAPCATFQEAARLLGLLKDDQEMLQTLDDAVLVGSAAQIRELFSHFLAYGDVSDPMAVWDRYKASMCDDQVAGLRTALNLPSQQQLSDEQQQRLQHQVLHLLEELLRGQGTSLARVGLPVPPALPTSNLLDAELALYDIPGLLRYVEQHAPLLNVCQRPVYDDVTRSVADDEAGLRGDRAFFLDSPGGGGKTFTINLLLAAVRAQGRVAVAVASSGIASLLLDGGTTAHSRFKIPIEIDASSSIRIPPSSPVGLLLRTASLVVWDEAPMAHRHCMEAVDKLFRDLMKNEADGTRSWRADAPFGGKTVLFSGDFRQVLPVVPRGTRAAIVNASLNKSDTLWPRIKVHKLTINMRVQRLLQQGALAAEQQEAADFSAELLRVGEGTGGKYEIPRGMCVPCRTPEGLIADIYGDLRRDPAAAEPKTLMSKCILTPLNKDVMQLNDMVTEEFGAGWAAPPVSRTYLSADYTSEDDDQLTTFPVEFLNTLDPQGMPPHKLTLKVGAPIILLRNLNPKKGLANGTRLIVKELRSHLIRATIVTGPHAGRDVLIPRIPLTPSDPSMPVKFTRRQFPIRPAFVMTVNKSQGQTFDKVGIYLPRPVFSHGQLYVAMSRVGARTGVRFLVTASEAAALQQADPTLIITDNVVYEEVFA